MQWDRKWLLRKINFQTFFFFVFSFNWGVIALQYCVGFYHISTWVSRRYTYVPCLVNLPPTSHPILPLWVVIEHGFELPASDSKFPLAVCFTYDNVDMSVLFSILFPPSPCPSPWPQVRSPCPYLHCSPAHMCVSTIIYVPCICLNVWCLSFSFWLLSLCLNSSGFIHLVRTHSNASLCMAE